ncbi:MAG: TFIIB-type zinc ribbon-containing protein [Candidatus Thorarchaeota archaeon]|nr:MAG: TFIIB-type zinc ribbon-containing protein [Candidatus Thorarchaeota archaeon]
MTDLRCPNCDGPFEVPENSSTAVCPYCGTTVQVRTGEILKESYVMRLQFSIKETKDKMLSWALKQLGVPKALETKAEIESSRLVYWPFWVVEVEAIADYSGFQKKPNFGEGDTASELGWTDVSEKGHLEMEKDIFVPAAANVPRPLMQYVIPTKRKEFFSKDVVKNMGGRLEHTVVERSVAIESAKESMRGLLREEAMKEVDRIYDIDAKLEVPAVFLVHIPVWHIKYSYSLRSYDALIDGASGRIIRLKFPRKLAYRAMTLMAGLLHLGVGGGIGLLLVYLGLVYFDMIFPTIFGAAFGLGMLAVSLRFFLATISLKAEEEMAE